MNTDFGDSRKVSASFITIPNAKICARKNQKSRKTPSPPRKFEILLKNAFFVRDETQ